MVSTDDIAPTLFVPAHPRTRDGEAQVVFEPHHRPDGSTVAVAYTSPAALAAALGEQQPWVALDPAGAAALLGAAGINQVVVDPPGRATAPRWDDARWADIARFQRRVR